VLAGRVAVLV